MKEDSRIELRTLGSVSLCRSLIMAGLVDRFRVVVFPVVTGATGQDRIYDGYPDIRLDLVESRTFEGGCNCWSTRPPFSTVRRVRRERRAERGHRSRCYATRGISGHPRAVVSTPRRAGEKGSWLRVIGGAAYRNRTDDLRITSRK
jgi:hypothetical protein